MTHACQYCEQECEETSLYANLVSGDVICSFCIFQATSKVLQVMNKIAKTKDVAV